MIWLWLFYGFLGGLFLSVVALVMDFFERRGMKAIPFLIKLGLIVLLVMACFKYYVIRISENLQEIVILVDHRMEGE